MAVGEMMRPAQKNLANAVDAMQLKVWLGQLSGAYLRGQEVLPFIDSRQITTGNSWQLPVFGYSDSGKHHAVGDSILEDADYRQTVPVTEKVMYVDKPYTINAFIPDWEEMQTHYDTRSQVIQGFAERHARHSDLLACFALMTAARSAANITGGGTSAEQRTAAGSSSATGASGQAAPTACDNAAMLTDGDVLVAALFAAAQRLDEQDAPSEGRIALLRPSQYYALVTNRQLLDRDVVRDNGDFADGTVFKCANIRLVKSNAIQAAAQDYSGATGEIVNYVDDYTENAGVVFHRDAALRLIRINMEMNAWEDKERYGWVLSTRRIDGYNVKKPEAVVELTV